MARGATAPEGAAARPVSRLGYELSFFSTSFPSPTTAIPPEQCWHGGEVSNELRVCQSRTRFRRRTVSIFRFQHDIITILLSSGANTLGWKPSPTEDTILSGLHGKGLIRMDGHACSFWPRRCRFNQIYDPLSPTPGLRPVDSLSTPGMIVAFAISFIETLSIQWDGQGNLSFSLSSHTVLLICLCPGNLDLLSR